MILPVSSDVMVTESGEALNALAYFSADLLAVLLVGDGAVRERRAVFFLAVAGMSNSRLGLQADMYGAPDCVSVVPRSGYRRRVLNVPAAEI